ncbi:efflux RND transporter periplasmic adaptor subunit [Dyella caseinilytica]|uniref:Efflux RND transporter periplasmic adaptor subunit n=1 Tax=Dyella caseinilytica TaxID=1849581 RepID=A0ABX7GR59_9GAMM|nr:efflux RND transporter periplasmic adaptor subunit [Dyella caseinilytica]QRN52851.1 efflux RND transporter periplasmic adaptor subunit [Dyella caseinilytica]GGA09259.1 acriflavin resistance protein [Dyella caseinilytica]
MSNTDLLKELRIERHQREDHNSGGSGRWVWIIAAIVLAIVVLGVGGWWMSSHRAIAVHTATAVAAGSDPSAGAVLQATGYVTARRQATVSAQITGTLTEVLIEEGDRVKKDQILARLDDSAYKAALDTAAAQAKAAYALVDQYKSQLAQNLRDATRDDVLAKQGLVSKQVAEQARTLADSTRAQLVSQQKQAAAADANTVQAQVNFDYCVIRAPFDGVITTKDAQIGEVISPFSAGGGFTRTGVGTIVDMNSLEVDVDVNEAYIGRVLPKMPAEAVLDAYPDWKIPAHVIAIVPAADRGKATVKVRVALEQKDARIVPDMGVRVSFLETKPAVAAQAPKGVLVPAKAIVQREGSDSVFIVAHGKARRQAVQPSSQDYGDMRLIPASVNAGDDVVLSPPDVLQDGSDVTVQAH